MDGIIFADFFAFFAANAAGITCFSGVGAFVVAGAANNDLDGFGDDPDLPAWTDLGTKATAFAQMRPDGGDPIFDANRVVGADLGAVTDSEAALGALGISCEMAVGGDAGIDSTVIVLSGGGRVVSAAGDVGNLRNNRLLFPLHHF